MATSESEGSEFELCIPFHEDASSGVDSIDPAGAQGPSPFGVSIGNQLVAAHEGLRLRIMVVGESGLGKTTFLHALMHIRGASILAEHEADLEDGSGATDAENSSDAMPEELKATEDEADEIEPRTLTIRTKSYMLKSDEGIKTRVDFIDTPGFADTINNEHHWVPIQSFVEDQFERYFDLSHGGKLDMDQVIDVRRAQQDCRVHLCLYFIAPHRLKEIDIIFMKRMQKFVNIVPIIAKVDSMTTKERTVFRQSILERMTQEGIPSYSFPMRSGEHSAPPFAVVCTKKKSGTRDYPWGELNTESPKHSDLSIIRDLIFRLNLVSVLKATHEKYEQVYARPRRRQRILERQRIEEQLKSYQQKVAELEDRRRQREGLEKQRQVELEAQLKACQEDLKKIRGQSGVAGWGGPKRDSCVIS